MKQSGPPERRTPLRAGKPLQRKARLVARTPLRVTPSMVDPKRAKRAKRARGRHKVPERIARQVRRRSGGRCEAMVAADCTHRGTSLHHRLMKAHTIIDTLGNLRDLCEACHGDTIHRHTGWAYRHGWLVLSTSDPDLVDTWLCPLDCATDHVGVGHHGG